MHSYHKTIPLEKMKQCEVDSDCVGVFNCACRCSGVGKGYDDAINKAYTTTWDWRHLCKFEQGSGMCLDILCEDRVPKCVSKKCQLQ